MAITCGKLNMGVAGADCENPLIQGVKPIVTLINHDDIDINATTIENGIITNLVLKAGVDIKGHKAETLPDGISANVAFAKGAYYSGWEHNFILRVFDNTPKVKAFIDELSRSRVVVVVENNYVKYNPGVNEKKGETVYEAYGFYNGLKLKEATRDSNDADTKGGYVLTCGCDDNSKEPMLPITIFKEDLEKTRLMIESLS